MVRVPAALRYRYLRLCLCTTAERIVSKPLTAQIICTASKIRLQSAKWIFPPCDIAKSGSDRTGVRFHRYI